MLTIHSPKFSTGKTQITKNSPTFRNKRAPSVQDSNTLESRSKLADSPTKLSEGRKKKSYLDLHPTALLAKSNKDKGTREIIDSIQNLKEQYKSLKDAYQELIYERTKNNKEISKVRSENMQLQIENQRILRENQRFKMQLTFQQQEIDRTKRQYANLLQVQKFKVQKLQESLHEKQKYISQHFLKIRTEGDQSIIFQKQNVQPTQDQVSLTISQDKSAVLQDHSINNQSQFLSFSLTSVLEQSTDKEPSDNRKKYQHARVASDLPPRIVEEDKKPHTFRRQKKEVPTPKLELANIESKSNLISTIPHRAFDKKSSKAKASKSYRDKQNRQTLNNGKKKSKKLINTSALDN